MSKQIKVKNATHEKLIDLMKPRESFDGVINRLIATQEKLLELTTGKPPAPTATD